MNMVGDNRWDCSRSFDGFILYNQGSAELDRSLFSVELTSCLLS